jgi:divalent metal cation (Fe/Co/Zn/Cd) transporter
VLGTGLVRLRWVGHQLRAECEIVVSGDITALEAHEIAVNAEHDLLHALPRLSAAVVHTDPQPRHGTDPHAVLAPHRSVTAASLMSR